METFNIGRYRIRVAGNPAARRVCYVLYPMDVLGGWIDETAERYGVAVAVVCGMDWDNELTPWPAKGVPAGTADFKGEAGEFLKELTGVIVPEIDRRFGTGADVERTLVGVSLSGLFALWQWLVSDRFDNIVSLSGSFWYEGFASWVLRQNVVKKGRAYFCLGDLESRTRVRAFQSVETDTREIVGYLKRSGVSLCFEMVPGNHYQNGLRRLDGAMEWMFHKADAR